MSLLERFANVYRTRLRPNEVAEQPAPHDRLPQDGLLVDLRNVVKNYSTPAGEFSALRGINLQVKAGEFTTVIGKSGSGKSTLINMVTGIDRPTLGEVIVNGTPIHNLNEDQMAAWRSRNLGVVFQFFQMLPTLTLIENVQMPMLISRRYPRDERPEQAMFLLDLVGLADQAYKFPSEVSGGQQQRAAIARALANDPKILVADEPTGSLDSKTGDAIFQIFEDFVSQGRTILMVTHDRDLARRVSRVIFISDGEIIDELIADALPTLNQRQQVEILSKLEAESYAPGEDIIRQGDPAQAFYIITRGATDVVMRQSSGQEILLNRLDAGQYFGEMAMLEGGEYTATVRAAPETEVTVMQLDRATLTQVMNESHLSRDAMAHIVRQRAIEANLQRALPSLTQDLVTEISQGLKEERYGPGETIIQQGDQADSFYILTGGNLDVVMTAADGEEARIGSLNPGQFFGEMGLMEGGVRTATVRVAPDSEATVMQLDVETFTKMRADSKMTSEQIAMLMQQRLIRNALSRSLPTLSAAQIVDLLADLELDSYPPGRIIVQAGDPANTFYVIAHGEVELVEQMADGATRVSDRLGEGDYFGEVGLLKGVRQPVTIQVSASNTAELVAIGQSTFDAMLATSEATRRAITQTMQQRSPDHVSDER